MTERKSPPPSSFGDGQYVIQLSPNAEPEVARFAGDVFVLDGMQATFLPGELYRIRPLVTIDDARMVAPTRRPIS